MNAEKIPLKDIKLDSKYDVRFGERSDDTILEYAEIIHSLPPVTVSPDYTLLDGYHRYYAHDAAGAEFIYVEIESEKDPLVAAIQANLKHGVPLATDHKRQWAELLEGRFTQSRIAEIFDVSQATISNWLSDIRKKRIEERNLEIISGYKAGKSITDIADELKLSVSTVYDVLKDAGIILRDPKNGNSPGGIYGHSKGNPEWYTPPELIDITRRVMRGIDLDPASCDEAQEWIKADQYYTKHNNGLDKDWAGRVFMNPPYDSESVTQFTKKLINSPEVTEYCVLINHATETQWCQDLLANSDATCFIRKRVKFVAPANSENKDTVQQTGQIIVYKGPNTTAFGLHFSDIGIVYYAR